MVDGYNSSETEKFAIYGVRDETDVEYEKRKSFTEEVEKSRKEEKEAQKAKELKELERLKKKYEL